jgi:hypothetical protein
MNLTFNCRVSLSKKIRSVINSNNARVVLHINNVSEGIGIGTLSIYTDEGNYSLPADFIDKETNISLIPISIQDEVLNINKPIGNIFSNNANVKNSNKSVIGRLAATSAPETKHEVAHAFKTAEDIRHETPEVFEEANDPRIKKFAKNFEELMECVNRARVKTSEIDLSSAKNERQKAILLEQIELSEAIDEDAYIVNTKCKSISVNDLGIQLVLNIPFNLNKVSAKRVATSKDLRSLIDSGFIKIIEPKNVAKYASLVANEEVFESGLKASGIDEAADNMFSDNARESASVMDLNSSELDGATEEEKLMSASNMGKKISGGINLSGGLAGSRRTTFSSESEDARPLARPLNNVRQSSSEGSTPNPQGIKTIKRKGT